MIDFLFAYYNTVGPMKRLRIHQPGLILLITTEAKLHRFVGPVYQSGCFFFSDSLRSQAYEKAIPTSPRACYCKRFYI